MLKRKITSVIVFALAILGAQAQNLSYQNTMTPTQLVNDILIGQGVTATNVTFNNSAANAGVVQQAARGFTATNFPFTNGVYLRTQGAASVAGDPQLNGIANGNVTNGAILEFDFVATGNLLSFRYIFASSEYTSFTCSGFNDAFGFFISGPGITGTANLATVPGTNVPVSINTVNSGTPSAGNPGPCAAADPNWQANSIYFTTQYGTFTGEGYNGSTVAMTAISNLICGETYHIKLAVANVLDQALNSGVYLEGGSFTVDPVEFGFNTVTNDNIMLEGCQQFAELIFTRSGCQNNNVPLTAYLDFAGTATNGVDYALLGDSVYFAPGVDTIIWIINPFEDGITEGQETIDMTITSYVMNDTLVSTATFYINDRPFVDVNGTDLTYVCLQDTATVSAVGANGVEPYSYAWDTGDSTQSILGQLNGNGVYPFIVTMTDACGYQDVDTVYVTMNQTLAIDTMYQFPATACNPDGAVSGVAVGFTGVPDYNWTGPGPNTTNGIDATVFQGLTSGWYYFTVTDNVCSVNDSIFVEQSNAPVAQTTPSIVGGCSPLTVTFTNESQNATSYKWIFQGGQEINTTELTSQTQVFTAPTNVQLIAFQGQCSDTADVFINIAECGCTDPLALNYNPLATFNDGSCLYPTPSAQAGNVFTPDGDGTNDSFTLIDVKNAATVNLIILNRWGNVMFDKTEVGQSPSWDGKDQNGNQVPEGVYFYKYVVTGVNGDSVDGHGFVQVLRKTN